MAQKSGLTVYVIRHEMVKGNIDREINSSRPNPKLAIIFVLSFISI